jgi:integrase
MKLKALHMNETYVFGSSKGRLDDSNFGKELKRRALLTGYTKPLHSHLFRKAGATHMGEAGVPLDIVSDILGHTDVNTTKKFYMIHARAAYRSAIRRNPLLQKRLDIQDRIDLGKEKLWEIFADVDHSLFKDALSTIIKEMT